MKEGKVLLIGRPNAGKSTFVNNLIGQKVAITSPKPQTTRFPIRAVYEEPRGRLIFVDTPGVFGKAQDYLSKKINERTQATFNESVDLVIYMIDHTRHRDKEEAKVLGMVRKLNAPKILVFNKIDITEPSYLPEYKFLEAEFSDIFYISSLQRKHFRLFLDKVFSIIPEQKKESDIPSDLVYPVLNMDSNMFLSELIREKVFLMMGEEIPYTTTVLIDEVTERSNKLTYIKARLLTTDDRYKRMIIGAGGRKIKEIGAYARKEIELATKRKIYLELTVETDPHWQETYYS